MCRTDILPRRDTLITTAWAILRLSYNSSNSKRLARAIMDNHHPSVDLIRPTVAWKSRRSLVDSTTYQSLTITLASLARSSICRCLTTGIRKVLWSRFRLTTKPRRPTVVPRPCSTIASSRCFGTTRKPAHPK